MLRGPRIKQPTDLLKTRLAEGGEGGSSAKNPVACRYALESGLPVAVGAPPATNGNTPTETASNVWSGMGGEAPKEGLLVVKNGAAPNQNGGGGQPAEEQSEEEVAAAEAAMDEERRVLVTALRQIGTTQKLNCV